ncbi:hypothetical protein CLTEP_06510 [Clostridium tepidiprofundi DSM 19306]|uniref:Uncharacterized protein n=1 Tax=Clostridium tepidiprofundi DSM 19306 TaxID=1121338 RepID=A0A151B6B6_9CLOT|nr:hypothetical protein [Clostridium tepidiprofundi]KYH35475.1 hypothetical protein CLTEP_06510 [Clostridium tepidiprofundi DSM 19306]
MQQKWDDLDKLILDSKQHIETSKDYNEILMNKIRNKKRKKSGIFCFNSDFRRIAAASCIMAGIFMMVMFTTDIQYNIIKTQYKIKMQIMAMQYKYGYTIDEILNWLGE